MMLAVLMDAGPLTALLNPNDEWHTWARDTMRRLPVPLLTSEPVLTEAAHLLRREGCDADELFALAEDGVIRMGLRFEDERAALRELMARYRGVPMSLADATLVRLAELNDDSRVFTLDADFRIYRRHRNKIIPVLMPDDDPTFGSRLAESPVPYRVRRKPAKGS
jgi:predicted nucleic acid-binding protein